MVTTNNYEIIAQIHDRIEFRDKVARLLAESYEGPESHDLQVADRIIALISSEYPQ